MKKHISLLIVVLLGTAIGLEGRGGGGGHGGGHGAGHGGWRGRGGYYGRGRGGWWGGPAFGLNVTVPLGGDDTTYVEQVPAQPVPQDPYMSFIAQFPTGTPVMYRNWLMRYYPNQVNYWYTIRFGGR
jgi:hypothetical protein